MKKQDFIRANKANVSKVSSNVDLNYRSVTPDGITRTPVKAYEAVRASANARYAESTLSSGAGRRTAGTPSPLRTGPRQSPTRIDPTKTPQPR